LHAAIVTRPPFRARTASGATREPREPTDPAGTRAFRRRADGVASLRSDIQERAEPRREADAADSVARAAAGDLRAFEVLYHAHLSRVHSLVRRMTGGRDTDELTQDVFVRVWQKLSTFRGDSAFTTWLHRLTVNVVIDGADICETLPAPARSGDLSMDFETAMTKLPDGAREIFVLHDVEGYKHHEIATLLEISAGTSKAQLHRARMMLRKHLR
jgi:RNA polymerase sigma-70 factor (ECF subfamily)